MFSYEESDRFTVMDNRQVICLGVHSQADELTVRHGLLQATADSSFSSTNIKIKRNGSSAKTGVSHDSRTPRTCR